MYLKKIKLSFGVGVMTLIMTYSINLNAQNCLPQATAQAYVTSAKITEGYNYFVSKGLTNAQIIAEFGSSNNPAIYTAYTITKFINDNSSIWVLDANNHIVNSSNPPSAYHCALEAFGIIGIAEMLTRQLTAEGMLTVIRKVAPKAMGVIGASWAIYEFGACMGWWGIAQYDHDFGNIVETNSYVYCE